MRARIEQRAGQPLYAWWGFDVDGRPRAAAFGPTGLCFADPAVRSDHSPTYRVSTYVTDPSSIRTKTIEHRPMPGGGAGGHTSSAPTRQAGDRQPPSPFESALGRTGLEWLGNLPPIAQQLIQEPFQNGEELLRDDCYYEGTAERLDVYSFVLAGPKTVTLAVGSMILPVGHSRDEAHWSLTCYRASVVKRIGQ